MGSKSQVSIGQVLKDNKWVIREELQYLQGAIIAKTKVERTTLSKTAYFRLG